MNTSRLLSSSTMTGDEVRNRTGDNLGKIEDLMLDVPDGKIAYAVLSFGGVFGIGSKLFAVPWNALTLNADEHCFVLDADKEYLKNAPGFDKDNWPDFASAAFKDSLHSYYGRPH